jgi:acylpyruvate hydrolase
MKLLNFYTAKNTIALGLVERDWVFDLTHASGGRREFSSVAAWLRAGEPARNEIRLVRDRALGESSRALPLAGLRHAPMVAPDSRIFCVGLNYADHAAENKILPPASPIFFAKLAAVVIPHGADIPLPPTSGMTDYEAEVAVVIGKRADRVSEIDAAACIAGFSIMNDVTARDFQRTDKQWFRGKNCNGFGPLGPWLVTADEIPDAHNLEITLHVNGELRQHSNTRNLVFPPEALISYLSQTLVLQPGDVISTGTPSGIGSLRKPPAFLGAGDCIQIEVTGVGVLENSVAGKKAMS